ncbi:4019_t:CDS:1 [Acaulospora morrowiae]|uniref:4019_t:CDS:1 n=1 Tax=Acaulospora morrowiae TaxID=94023 RepID=A0A9N8VQK8_9GLOM|nr:4019_t:CDS:1 [Acaulospora morrowiae]
MTTSNFSIEDLANSLIGRLDRERIFPPQYSNPESFVAPATAINAPASCRRPRRPPNAFLLCRKNVHQEAKRRGTCNMRVISKVTGILWRNASLEEKEVYERLADQVNEIHVQRHTILYRQQQQALLAASSRNVPLRPVAYKPYPTPSTLTMDDRHKSYQLPTPPMNSFDQEPIQIPSPPILPFDQRPHHQTSSQIEHSNNGQESLISNQFIDNDENFVEDSERLFYYFNLWSPQQQQQ